jgi:hypothetical protein
MQRTQPRGASARAWAWAGVLASALAACAPPAPNATPEGASRTFFEQLARYEGAPEDAKRMLELLSKGARENLLERAQRYGAASGKSIAPERMIAPGAFLQRFEPVSYRAEIRGEHARVTVRGAAPEEQAIVPCVLEEGLWRLDVRLPHLPPLEVRPRDAEDQQPRAR